MTAIAGAIDLSWVSFTADDEASCDGTVTEVCTLEAVARSVWAIPCGHRRPAICHCTAHLDMLKRALAATGLHCRICREPLRLLRIERLR